LLLAVILQTYAVARTRSIAAAVQILILAPGESPPAEATRRVLIDGETCGDVRSGKGKIQAFSTTGRRFCLSRAFWGTMGPRSVFSRTLFPTGQRPKDLRNGLLVTAFRIRPLRRTTPLGGRELCISSGGCWSLQPVASGLRRVAGCRDSDGIRW